MAAMSPDLTEEDLLIQRYADLAPTFFKKYILLELPEGVDAWVAGGALRDYFLYGYIKGETDIDIFTTDQGNFNLIVNELHKYYNRKGETDFAITFTDKEDEEKIVQVIKKFYKSGQECIKTFDLTCCCAYIGMMGDDNVYFDSAKEFYTDNCAKKLRFVNLHDNPTLTLSRIAKYQKKGFEIEDDEMLAIIRHYLNNTTDFAKFVDTYQGLELQKKSTKKGQWFATI